MKVTLKDIARKSGYSVSTVSRVLGGSNSISPAAKKVILQAARELNYPLIDEHDRVTAYSGTDVKDVVALVTGFAVGEFYASFYSGLHEAAVGNKIRLYLLGITQKNELFEFVEDVKRQHFDGAILFAPEFKRRDYKQFQKLLPDRFPVVSNALIENPVFNTITFDGYSGGYLAAKHLEQRGYKKLGIIRGPIERAESRYRHNGFRDYIDQSDPMELIWDFEGDFMFESGRDGFAAFRKLRDKPEALFISNDTMAFAFMNAARNAGFCIPDDIAIVGYDNQTMSWQYSPTLTTIKTDYKRLGLASFNKLQELIDNPEPNHGMLSQIPVTLVAREST